MKIALFSFVVSIFSIVNLHCAEPQSKDSEYSAAEILRAFYTNYITFIDGGDLKKIEALQKEYCTPKLFRKIAELGRKNDQDPFLKAQDSNIKFLKTLVVEKDDKKEGHYIVSYGSDERIVINVTLVKVNGSYKIDNVW